jgi:hypothetical protein
MFEDDSFHLRYYSFVHLGLLLLLLLRQQKEIRMMREAHCCWVLQPPLIYFLHVSWLLQFLP